VSGTADPLVLSHFCIRDATFEQRARAARSAGLDEIGLSSASFEAIVAGGADPADLSRVLTRNGVHVTELEVLRPWAFNERGRAAAIAAERTMLEMAELFGARYLQVIGPFSGTVDDAAEVFAGLCDRVAEVGLVAGIEFLPFTNIPDAAVALAIVERADRANGGVCVDAWHFFRGAADWEMLEALPPNRIAAVQICDGTSSPENPEYLADCLQNRRVPGEGEFDLPAFLRVLDKKPASVHVSIEVISSQLDRLPPEVAVRRMVEATRATLAQA
jgi:sugar phosphate isomerase/epimerase